MVEQILQRRRNTMIVFAGDDDEGVAFSIEDGERLQDRRRFPRLVFLVHTVEERQALLGRIDQSRLVAALLELAIDETSSLDALAFLTHRAVENCKQQGHSRLL